MTTYLPAGLPAPTPAPDGLDAAYWEAAAEHRLVVQRCGGCGRHQWGPEWICHRCRSFDLGWADVEPTGVIYSWERVWHPVHAALPEACPYVVVLVELPHADGVRMVGNLLGDATDPVVIGAPVEAVFEDHDGDPPYTLVQWRRTL
ncbi:MAG TPA: OB-fold domain-containing protein [Acidimicrobiales bacterium]|nr:OB-fold domain-containing protein [Acidimicrobiales bacterium]